MINYSIIFIILLIRNVLYLKSVIYVILIFKVWNDIYVFIEY